MLRYIRPAVVAALLLLVPTTSASAAARTAPAFDSRDFDVGIEAFGDAWISGTVRERGTGVSGVKVFADLDKDGAHDPEEPWDETVDEGMYSLNAGQGEHIVRVELPPGYLCGEPACAKTVYATYYATQYADFAIVRPGTVAGTVMEDGKGNGIDQDDWGVGGMPVYVDEDGDGLRDLDEPSVSTSPSGSYTLPALEAGEHTVRLDAASQWRCFEPADCAQTVTVDDGRTTTLDFRAWRTSVVHGTVFVDVDGDGQPREPADTGSRDSVAYVDVDRDGEPDAGEPMATTHSDGAYTIPEVPPGMQLVRVVEAKGWQCVSPVPCEGEVDVSTGSLRMGPDFGLAQTSADLGVTLARTPEVVVAGTSVTWTVTVRNDGPAIANNATLDLALPDGLRDFAASPPDGMTCAGVRPAVQCELGDLLSGASVSFSFFGSIKPDRAGDTLPFTAVVRADNEDLDPSDNRAEEAPPVTGVADLRTVATLPPTAEVGQVVDLVVQLRNDGPSDASGVTVVATLPEGIEPVGDQLPEECTVVARAVTCASAGVRVGSGLARSIPVKVGAAAAGKALSVPVSATSDASDPTPGDAATEVPLEARAVPPAPAPAPPDDPKPEPEPELVVDAPPAPPAAECRSTRAFDVHVSRRYGRLRKVTMTLAGRRLVVRRRNGRFTARVDLRGRPAGEWVLRIRAVTARGKVIRGTRTYHTCTTKKEMGLPPL